MHHGIQHLCRSHADFSHLLRPADHPLLKHRNVFQRNLYAQIASCDHDAIRFLQNAVQIPDALHAFNLGNNFDVTLILRENPANLTDILCRSGKGSRNIVKSKHASEFNVASILLADKRHGQITPGHIDTLMIGNGPAVYHRALNVRFAYLVDLQFNQAVIDQNTSACFHILRQVLIGHGSTLPVSVNFLRGQCEFLSGFEHNLTFLKIAKADFRSSCIQKRRHRKILLDSDLLQLFEFPCLFFMCPVGKIKSRHIHTGINQTPDHFLILTCRSQCADDFCFSHVRMLLIVFFYNTISIANPSPLHGRIFSVSETSSGIYAFF